MAATDATPFPVYGQAYRIPCVFRDTTGDLITGWTSAAAHAYPDNGAGVSLTIAEAPASSGVGYIDIPLAQMQCSMCLITASIANSGATGFAFAVNPLDLRSIAGRYDAHSPVRFEQMWLDIYADLGLNGTLTTGAQVVQRNADQTDRFKGSIVQGQLAGFKEKVV